MPGRGMLSTTTGRGDTPGRRPPSSPTRESAVLRPTQESFNPAVVRAMNPISRVIRTRIGGKLLSRMCLPITTGTGAPITWAAVTYSSCFVEST